MKFQRILALGLLVVATSARAQVGVEEEAKQLKSKPQSTQKMNSSKPVVSLTPANSLPSTTEDWKGPAPESEYGFSAMTGLGILTDQVGLPLIGTLSRRILSEGFIEDITDPVSLEAAFGPMFIKSTTAWLWSAHMRWDFVRDDQVTLFALGGIGGNFIPSALGKRQEFFPRVGVGMFYTLTPAMKLRAEVGHEWITAGVAFSF